jgi:hypothetical protein
VLSFQRVKKSLEIGPVFAREDERSGVESMLQAIPADDSASSSRFGAGAFFGVSPVSFYLSCSCHIGTLAPKIADGS